MDRDEAIKTIEILYPADDDHEDTAKVGRELLEQAKVNNWRAEPTPILIRYAKLCIDYDLKHTL